MLGDLIFGALVIWVVAAIIIERRSPKRKERLRQEQNRLKEREEFKRIISLPPFEFLAEMARKEEERQAQIRWEWSLTADEYAAYLETIHTKWPRKEIAQHVKARMIAKIERTRSNIFDSKPSGDELQEIEDWVRKYCDAGS